MPLEETAVVAVRIIQSLLSSFSATLEVQINSLGLEIREGGLREKGAFHKVENGNNMQ